MGGIVIIKLCAGCVCVCALALELVIQMTSASSSNFSTKKELVISAACHVVYNFLENYV